MFPVRSNIINFAISYSLDQRVFLLTLHQWFITAFLAEFLLCLRDHGMRLEPHFIDTDEVSLLAIRLSSAAKFKDLRVVQWTLPSFLRVYQLFPAPKVKFVDVRFYLPSSTANSTMEMFKFMNLVDVVTKSPVLNEVDLQFASERLLLIVPFECPNSFAVYDYVRSLQ